jgi:hypothetical protein
VRFFRRDNRPICSQAVALSEWHSVLLRFINAMFGNSFALKMKS